MIAYWPYQVNGISKIVVTIEMQVVSTQKFQDATLIVDTGYDGDIFLTQNEFRQIGYHKILLPRNMWNFAETVTGEIIELIKSRGNARIGQEQFEIEVESHYLGEENIVGRKFLKRFLTELNGLNEKISLFQTSKMQM